MDYFLGRIQPDEHPVAFLGAFAAAAAAAGGPAGALPGGEVRHRAPTPIIQPALGSRSPPPLSCMQLAVVLEIHGCKDILLPATVSHLV